jgi:adenine/guanine phosphoribosyltransferase-like PRPP-binding protein
MNIDKIFDGEIIKEKYATWASQFDKSELPIIEKLVANFTYVSLRKLQIYVQQLHNEIANSIKDIDNVIFVPVGYVVKSGSVVAYFYKKENELRENMFIPYSDLTSQRIASAEAIVFIDDFVGTGNQAVQIWHDIKNKFVKQDTKAKFFYATLVSYEHGIDKIKNNTQFQTVSIYKLGAKNDPLSPRSTCFNDDEERAQARRILTKYGERLYEKYPLGYKNSSGLIGFFYSTPNNTLPIFWSAKNEWSPLISRGDDFRDPLYLVGPSIETEQSVQKNKLVFGDEDILDKFNIDHSLLPKLLQEFKETKLALIIGKIFAELEIKPNVVDDLLIVLNKLKNAVHEKEKVTSAIFVSKEEVLNKIDYFLKAHEVNSSNLDKVLELAYQVNGYDAALAISNKGLVFGNFSYDESTEQVKFIPYALRHAAFSTTNYDGLLLVFNGNDNANIFWQGHKLVSYKGATWHMTPSKLDTLIQKLSYSHNISTAVLNNLFEVAIEMSSQKEGALITIGDHENVLLNAADIKDQFIRLGNLSIVTNKISQLVKIFSQDGATLISKNGDIIQHKTTLRPSPNPDVVKEIGKGTKHETAQVISSITNAICIAISVDGNFTVYSRGDKILRMTG